MLNIINLIGSNLISVFLGAFICFVIIGINNKKIDWDFVEMILFEDEDDEEEA